MKVTAKNGKVLFARTRTKSHLQFRIICSSTFTVGAVVFTTEKQTDYHREPNLNNLFRQIQKCTELSPYFSGMLTTAS
jgi:hypothetical protein